MDYGECKAKRISSKGEREKSSIREILDGASSVARRVLESIQKIAGTTYCKGVQIHELYKYAVANGFFIQSIDNLGTFSDRGSENEVYMSFDNKYVYKLNDFRYSDDNLTSFFERIYIHNRLFPDCEYQLYGFAYNKSDKFCAVLRQPFIHALREATEQEIATQLINMGFAPEMDGSFFSNGTYDIFDALPNNVLVGKDNHLYFIDTIIYKSDSSNISKYKSLSPRFM